MWLVARTQAGVEPVVYYASWHSQGRSGESHERRGHSPDRTAGRISHTGTPETRQWEQGYDTHTNITHHHHTNITHTTHTNTTHQHHSNITHTHTLHTNITHWHDTNITHTPHTKRCTHLILHMHRSHKHTHMQTEGLSLLIQICSCLPVGPESPPDTHSSICNQRQSNALKEKVTEHKDNQSPEDWFWE